MDYLKSHVDEMVNDLEECVSLETPSDDKHLLDVAFPKIIHWIYSTIGNPTREERIENRDWGNIAVLDYGNDDPDTVILVHYDTVWPKGTFAGWHVNFKGERLSGPGIFDMKAGMVQAVWAIRAIQNSTGHTPNVRIIMTGDEETGSFASREVIEAKTRGKLAVYVFEGSIGGALKTARKGVGCFEIVTSGIESHAGLDPLAGASAVHGIGEIISQLASFADLESGTSVNVGTVSGGTRSNVTAGKAVVGVDVRISQPAEMHRIDNCIALLSVSDTRVAINVTGGWNRPPFERTPEIAALFERAQMIARHIGVELGEKSVGGASDGNFVAALGVPVLDGLGAVGDGAHARHEYCTRTGLIERSVLAAGLMLTSCS